MKQTIVITIFFCLSFFSCYNGWDEVYNAESNIILSPPDPPDAPVVTEGDGILALNWAAVKDAESYEVWFNMSDNSTDAEKISGSDDVTALTYKITGLANETTYFVWLKSKNSSGTSGFGKSANGTPGRKPSVTTTSITGNLTFTPFIAGISARGGGDVTSSGSSSVQERGLCWNITGNPIITDFSASDGIGTGVFINSRMKGLSRDTVYYVKAYATNRAGTAYGDEITFNTGKVFGIEYAGGYVFYNDGNGHGLVCAKTDQSTSIKWYNGTSLSTGATSAEIGSGSVNTETIIREQGTSGSYAAALCDGLTIEGYSDWFLPSKDELGQMYSRLKDAGIGNFANNYYWSSTEVDEFNTWTQFFNDGYQYYYFKGNTYYVRPVRAF